MVPHLFLEVARTVPSPPDVASRLVCIACSGPIPCMARAFRAVSSDHPQIFPPRVCLQGAHLLCQTSSDCLQQWGRYVSQTFFTSGPLTRAGPCGVAQYPFFCIVSGLLTFAPQPNPPSRGIGGVEHPVELNQWAGSVG